MNSSQRVTPQKSEKACSGGCLLAEFPEVAAHGLVLLFFLFYQTAALYELF